MPPRRPTSARPWKRTRQLILTRDASTCQIRTPGICTTNATHIDHIIPVTRGGTDNPDNLRAACAACNLHRGDRAYTIGPKIDNRRHINTPGRNVTLIVGPPAAGKTTRAHQLGGAVYDRDDYATDAAFVAAVARAASHPAARIAVIRCCETIAEQAEWAALTGATRIEVMQTSLDECLRRARARARPGWRGEMIAIRRWHQHRADTAATAHDPEPVTRTAW